MAGHGYPKFTLLPIVLENQSQLMALMVFSADLTADCGRAPALALLPQAGGRGSLRLEVGGVSIRFSSELGGLDFGGQRGGDGEASLQAAGVLELPRTFPVWAPSSSTSPTAMTSWGKTSVRTLARRELKWGCKVPFLDLRVGSQGDLSRALGPVGFCVSTQVLLAM